MDQSVSSSPPSRAATSSASNEEDLFLDLPDKLRLCYRQHGGGDGEAVLLISGLGMQLISWPDFFIEPLVAQSYRVIVPDNRDVGRSSRITTPPPGRLRQLLSWPPLGNYSLDDMADDMARLLTALGHRRAHLVGMSMGGMIAQTLASRRPDLTLSLTSIFSTTGDPAYGRAAASTLRRMARGGRPTTREQSVNRFLDIMRHIGDPTVPGIVEQWRDYSERAWDRSGQTMDLASIARQIGAIQKSGNRTAMLARIEVPTLVVHGDVDLIVDPSGGLATARAIAGARHQTIKGMRHQIDSRVNAELIGHLLPHLRRATARSLS